MLTGSELTILRRVFFLFALLTALLLTLWCLRVNQSVSEMILARAALLGLLLLCCWDSLSKHAFNRQRIRLPVIIIGLTCGLLISAATKWYQLTLLRRGLLVNPGAGQVDPELLGAATILIAVFLGPMLEELFFRFIGLGLAVRAKWPLALVTPWLITLSAVFALLHQPDWLVFPVYFLTGIVLSLLYLKYGLLYSFLAHAAGNAATLLFSMAR